MQLMVEFYSAWIGHFLCQQSEIRVPLRGSCKRGNLRGIFCIRTCCKMGRHICMARNTIRIRQPYNAGIQPAMLTMATSTTRS
ncbi:MAG: hypothetical protein EBT92_02230 [Planctomycetes bacterium]|nr:hypothetical protein [Planctomycetota bacterium]